MQNWEKEISYSFRGEKLKRSLREAGKKKECVLGPGMFYANGGHGPSLGKREISSYLIFHLILPAAL